MKTIAEMTLDEFFEYMHGMTYQEFVKKKDEK